MIVNMLIPTIDYLDPKISEKQFLLFGDSE